jgi:hypothetical protein
MKVHQVSEREPSHGGITAEFCVMETPVQKLNSEYMVVFNSVSYVRRREYSNHGSTFNSLTAPNSTQIAFKRSVCTSMKTTFIHYNDEVVHSV